MPLPSVCIWLHEEDREKDKRHKGILLGGMGAERAGAEILCAGSKEEGGSIVLDGKQTRIQLKTTGKPTQPDRRGGKITGAQGPESELCNCLS